MFIMSYSESGPTLKRYPLKKEWEKPSDSL